MYKSAKRVYTELNYINLENEKNPQSRKFIIDRTPFDKDDDSVAPTIVKDDRGQYYLIVGRILPTSEIYNRNAFTIQMKIPVEYPFRPPEIEMITPIYHPNIGPEGKICISMLRSTETWKTSNTLNDVIKAVVDYIDHPNIDEAHSKQIADEYVKDRAEFNRKANQKIDENPVSRQ